MSVNAKTKHTGLLDQTLVPFWLLLFLVQYLNVAVRTSVESEVFYRFKKETGMFILWKRKHYKY